MKKPDAKSKGRRSVRHAIAVLFLLFVSLGGLCFTSCEKKPSTSAPPRLIVGWQTAWATCGQVVETLVHTSIPKLYSSNATFRNFLFGPDMIEAALTGGIDATTTGVVPVINLLGVSDDWVSVCRLIDFQVSMVARDGTGIKSIADLKGRRVGVPFGGGSHPYVLQRLRENNLPIGTGPDAVELINVTPAEAVTVMQQGSVDAVATWEPQVTIIESKGYGRSIEDERLTGFVTVRNSLVEKNPEQVVALIMSFIEANLYVANNREQTDEWFAKRSNFDRELLKKIRIIEPNLKAHRIQDISVRITPGDIALTQKVADQMLAGGLIKRPVKFADHVNLVLEKRATDELFKAGSKASSIRLVDVR
jgi:sulfonate transport system substrate-binding protein